MYVHFEYVSVNSVSTVKNLGRRKFRHAGKFMINTSGAYHCESAITQTHVMLAQEESFMIVHCVGYIKGIFFKGKQHDSSCTFKLIG